MEIRNYNEGRVKELFIQVLREKSSFIEFDEKKTYQHNEFDLFPKKFESTDMKSLTVKRYNRLTGEIICICVIRDRYLNLIQDGRLTDEQHEYNLFKKYAEVFFDSQKQDLIP
tara:strand:- start:1066 stop:1404 length:339 start_codon:yes stop_codon:yes gene_type:complete